MPNDIQVLPQSKAQRQEFSWGNLTWFANRALGNSDDMTVGRCIIKPGHTKWPSLPPQLLGNAGRD